MDDDSSSKSGVRIGIGIDYWRKYFRSANTDIFQVIENAILVAASDCPKEFKNRRDRIAEKLFTCKLTRCFGCLDRVEQQQQQQHLEEEEEVEEEEEEEEEGDVGLKNNNTSGVVVDDFVEGKGSKGNSSSNDHSELKKNNGNGINQVSNYSYDEAEALTEEIEEETQIVGEVLRIKEILYNSQDESDGVLFESLRRLQLMALSVETLQTTEIGKAVNHLRKHGSKQIRHLARTLIDEWKVLVDEWVAAAAAAAAAIASSGSDGSPDSVKPSAVDEEEEEEGLPSPPLDEGAFFATPTIELSQFFDGMDDDGNPRNNGEFDNNNGNGRKYVTENHNIPRRRSEPVHEVNVLKNKNKSQQMRKNETVMEQTKAPNSYSGPRRFLKPSSEQKPNNEMKMQQKLQSGGIQKKPLSGQQDKSNGSDGVSAHLKLEAAKRKLQEGYQQAENAKKQRTIQVMELHDLPKQGHGHKNPHLRPGGGHNRNWMNGRR